MSADQDTRIHKVIAEVDGSPENLVYVLRRALMEAAADGFLDGYTAALRDQHQAQRLAGAREKRAAEEAGTENSQ